MRGRGCEREGVREGGGVRGRALESQHGYVAPKKICSHLFTTPLPISTPPSNARGAVGHQPATGHLRKACVGCAVNTSSTFASAKSSSNSKGTGG